MKKFIMALFLVGCGRTYTYNTYAVLEPMPSPSPGTSTYVGCYTDTSNRALPAFLIQSGTTLETCLQVAIEAGYKYVGLEYGGQCFAGNILGYQQVADSNCNTPCSASAQEICGGTWLMSVYSTGLQ